MSITKVPGAQSFARAVGVLNLISEASTPPTMAELLKRCELTRPTLYRIIASLQAEDLVLQSDDQRYVLGPRLIALAHQALAQNDIRPIARKALEALRDETGETVHLAIRCQMDMVYIDKIESTQTVRMASEIGTRVALHSSSVGRAYLAALREAQCTELINELPLHPITKRTPTTKTRLEKIISTSRACGYSYEEEENESGIVCFGAPICDASGQPIAAVSVSVPVYRKSPELEQYWQPLRAHCKEISKHFGHIEAS